MALSCWKLAYSKLKSLKIVWYFLTSTQHTLILYKNENNIIMPLRLSFFVFVVTFAVILTLVVVSLNLITESMLKLPFLCEYAQPNVLGFYFLFYQYHIAIWHQIGNYIPVFIQRLFSKRQVFMKFKLGLQGD